MEVVCSILQLHYYHYQRIEDYFLQSRSILRYNPQLKQRRILFEVEE